MEENRAKACCGFGHKDVFQNINESLENAVLLAIKNSCEIFYTGAMGDFDNLFSCAVRKAKKTHPNIKLICVKPYMTQDINNNGDFLFSLYDDIIDSLCHCASLLSGILLPIRNLPAIAVFIKYQSEVVAVLPFCHFT